MDTLQAEFDNIVREAEVKLMEATIANLCSEVKEHQEAICVTTANIYGTIARCKVEILKHKLSETKAKNLVEAATAFVEKLTKDRVVSGASRALQAEINRTAKCRSQAETDESNGFMPSEYSIRDIVCNELRLQSMSTANPPEGNRQRKVSLVDPKSGSKRKGKSRISPPEQQQQQQQQRQRSNSPKRSKDRFKQRKTIKEDNCCKQTLYQR